MPTNGMTIDSLNTVSSLTAQDEVPVWDKEALGEPTRKITAQNMANSVKSLASLPNTTEMNTAIDQSTVDVIRTGDVVNSLTIDDTTGNKPAGQHEVYQLNTYTRGIAGLQSGANYISSIICAGYNTGSGNYVSVFVPVNTNNRTVSSVTASSRSVIFDATGRQAFTSNPAIAIIETTKFGIHIDITYESTKTPNIPANAYLLGVTINCT